MLSFIYMDQKAVENAFLNLFFSAGVISLANGYTFDYETMSSFYLTVRVKDEHLPGILPQVLTVNINDVNEDPRLKLKTTQLTTQEGNVRHPCSIYICLQFIYIYNIL